MTAWKLRTPVYGSLAALAALALWGSGTFAGEPADPLLLKGSGVSVTVRGTRVLALDVERTGADCRGSVPAAWRTTLNAPDVDWRQSGLDITVHQHPATRGGWDVDSYMRGRVSADGRTVSGSVWFSARRGAQSCNSRLMSFSAQRP
jgi:hypothetical protein